MLCFLEKNPHNNLHFFSRVTFIVFSLFFVLNVMNAEAVNCGDGICQTDEGFATQSIVKQ